MKDRQYRHLLLRPSKTKVHAVRLTFLPNDAYSRDQWDRQVRAYAGTLNLYRGQHGRAIFAPVGCFAASADDAGGGQDQVRGATWREASLWPCRHGRFPWKGTSMMTTCRRRADGSRTSVEPLRQQRAIDTLIGWDRNRARQDSNFL